MIGFLRGKLLRYEGHRGVLDVRDVGYLVHAPTRTLAAWLASEHPIEAWVSTQVREDAIDLFAFDEEIERQAFEVLISVNGVGPKLALACLDTHSVEALARAVERDDTKALARVSGVGNKLAQRLALELKGKLPAAFAPVSPEGVPLPEAAAPAEDDLLSLALARLGYARAEILRARDHVVRDGLADKPVADQLRAALRYLSGPR